MITGKLYTTYAVDIFAVFCSESVSFESINCDTRNLSWVIEFFMTIILCELKRSVGLLMFLETILCIHQYTHILHVEIMGLS